MTDLNANNFKTGNYVDITELHTATFDISGSEFTPSAQYPYVNITPTTTRVGTVDANANVNVEDGYKSIVSSRSYMTDTSFVDFDISLNDGSFNLLIRQDGDVVAVSEPTDELIASYARAGVGMGSEHIMTSVGCFKSYTRTSFNQMFRAEETGTLSKLKINEDFIDPTSVVSISICEMDISGVGGYIVVHDVSAVLLTNEPVGTSTETFDVTGATDISCVTFDVSGAGFDISQHSLYMMIFNGAFDDMGIWGEGMSMLDMDVSDDVYEPTPKKPYPMEVTVKSTSVSGKTDSGGFGLDISNGNIIIQSPTIGVTPHIRSLYNDISGGMATYDVIMGFVGPDINTPHSAMTACILIRIRHDTSDGTFRAEGVRVGSYGDTVMPNFPRATATADRLLVKTGDNSMLVMSYFDISENEFKIIRCSVDDLLYHPPVFNDGGENPLHQDAIGDNTMWGFAERLEAIGRATHTKTHTIPYDGVPNSGMRMACDAEGDANNQWVAYTDLRYATNTDANIYMVNMSAIDPDTTLFHIPLRNPLPMADLSYRYFLATFPTISMCGGGDVRHVSVGRNVYAYDTRANTVTFVSADVSVYRVDVVAGKASYVGTVGMDGTEMPGFSQYVDLSGGTGGVPYLHYTVTDVSGSAWGAKELTQPLNNHHMFRDETLYDVSNEVVNVRYVELDHTTPTSFTPFHADVSGNLNVSGDCYANNFVARHTDANSVVVNHSLWANRVEAASVSVATSINATSINATSINATSINATSISIGGVELTSDQLQQLLDLLLD